MRSMRFKANTPQEASEWQRNARTRLFELMMGGQVPTRPEPQPQFLKRETSADGTCVFEELTLKSLPDRTVHAWIGLPGRMPAGRIPGILALHGHGGTGEEVMRGQSLYWYGNDLIRQGYAVASLDIGQHELQHKEWTLMGERTWDALAVLDYLSTRPEVDPDRIGVIGLSLGGETTMYVAALDERIQVAVSSGWLTTVANMKNGHCVCFNFPGLEEHFDFSDIFACVAPRYLMAQVGRQEKAPGGFPVPIAQQAFEEIQRAYRLFQAEDRCQLALHEGGHVLVGEQAFPWIQKALFSR